MQIFIDLADFRTADVAVVDLDQEGGVNGIARAVVDGEFAVGGGLQTHGQVEIADAAIEEEFFVVGFVEELVVDLEHGRIGLAGEAIMVGIAGGRRKHGVFDAVGRNNSDVFPRERGIGQSFGLVLDVNRHHHPHGRIKLGEQAFGKANRDVGRPFYIAVKVGDGRFHALERWNRDFGVVLRAIAGGEALVEELGLLEAVIDKIRQVGRNQRTKFQADAIGAGETGERAPFVDDEFAGIRRACKRRGHRENDQKQRERE